MSDKLNDGSNDLPDMMEAPTERLRPVMKESAADSAPGSQVNFVCPGCGAGYEIDFDCVGNKLSCGHCDTDFRVLDEHGATSLMDDNDKQTATTSDGSSIRAKCPSCENVYNLDRSSIGRKMECGVCNQTFVLLDLTGQTSALSGGPNRKSAPAPKQVVMSDDGVKHIECACPKCGYSCELDDSMFGEKVICASCNSAFVVLDLTGVTILCDDVKSKKRAVVTTVKTQFESTVSRQPERASGWTAGSIAMAIIGLILLVLAGIYLFHPASPFNSGIGLSASGRLW